MDPTELFPWLFGGSMALTIVLVILSICVSILCTVLPIGGVIWYIRKQSQKSKSLHQASQGWRSTQGLVLKSRVEVSGGEYTSVTPYVLYEYEVGGQTYQNTQIRAGDRFMRVAGSREAYEIVERYPVSAVVPVYYDPANPNEAALER